MLQKTKEKQFDKLALKIVDIKAKGNSINTLIHSPGTSVTMDVVVIDQFPIYLNWVNYA